jgi:hypothetical protein
MYPFFGIVLTIGIVAYIVVGIRARMERTNELLGKIEEHLAVLRGRQ